MYSTVSCNISITCSLAHTTAREGNGMSGTTAGDASGLDLDTHSRLGLAGLESCLFQSLVKLISVQQPAMHFLFKIGSQTAVIYKEPFLCMGSFPSKKVSNTGTIPTLLSQCFRMDYSGTVGILFLFVKTTTKEGFTTSISECCNPGTCYSNLQSL